MSDMTWHFGKDFLWGSVTAAYQVEGGCTNNQWYRFESAVDEKGRPRILNGQKAGFASDHWRRYEEDIRLMKGLDLNAYRFSVEWSKIEPEPGRYNAAALEHYEKVVDTLLANGIRPMVTLHHFTDPIWFEERGAFLRDDSPEVFARFVEKVVRRLSPRVRLWCTINEPSVYSLMGYFTARFPPARREPENTALTFWNLLRSHTAAYNVIKSIDPQAGVGLAAAITIYDPRDEKDPDDVAIARAFTHSVNESHFNYLVRGELDFSLPGVTRSFKGGVRDGFDFVGLNYYTRRYRSLQSSGPEPYDSPPKLPKQKVTDMGWEIYPEGLHRALELIAGFTSKPVYITENGIADDSDTKRARFIEDHLRVLDSALAGGMNIKGYFYWSLIDNFEWAFGFTKRFGLYHVDYTTQRRTLREGSRKYAEIIREANAG
jgi:beta-glucosidase